MNKLLILLALILPALPLYSDDFLYSSTSEGVTTVETWSISFTDQGFFLYAGGPDKQVEMDGRSNTNGQGIRITYRVPGENKFITAELDGNSLVLTGVDEKGRQIKKNVKLKYPWFTSFYILPHFINSSEKQIDFCILEPLRNTIVNIRAIKEQEEILIIEGKEIETVKVCITLPNIAGAFWRSYIWYRKSDGIFVKTEETRGFPGTPRTYVILKNP